MRIHWQKCLPAMALVSTMIGTAGTTLGSDAGYSTYLELRLYSIQEGQRDRGLTTDSSAGHRAMQTFRKLPTMAPTSPAKATTSDTGHGSTVTNDLVQ